MKGLPIGIQSLANIREFDYVYIDKTEWAYKMLKAPAYYFLSRPRRFGKSLYLDTLKQIFLGNKHLFKARLYTIKLSGNRVQLYICRLIQ